MSPAKIFAKCRSDHTFLVRHYALEALFLAVGIGSSFAIRHPQARLHLGPAHLALALVAVPVGWRMASLLHNAGHGNFPGRRVNRAVGELAANYLLYGFANFVLIHALHHAYSDREHDPVSPRGRSFLAFLFAPMRYATARARRYLFLLHRGKRGYEAIRVGELVLFHVNIALRALLWFGALGPDLFVSFYLPSVASNVAILAHINFVCHRNRNDGAVEVVNHQEKLYYRVANWVTVGGYFHKNHHLQPRLYDPRALEEPARPTLTVEPSRTATTTPPATGSCLERYFDIAGIWGGREGSG